MNSLDPDIILSLLSKPTPHLHNQVENRIAWSLQQIRHHLAPELAAKVKHTEDITVTYDLKGHTAGYARYKDDTIRLNLDLLKNPETQPEMLRETVPHEVAHLVTHWLYPKASHHGYEWQRMMLLLGLEPKRTHNMPTTAARKRNQTRYTYECDCRQHKLSVTRHRRVQQGTHAYSCRFCNGRLRYIG